MKFRYFDEFRQFYDVLAELGVCDGGGGAECRRVYASYCTIRDTPDKWGLESGDLPLPAIAAFIRVYANELPSDWPKDERALTDK